MESKEAAIGMENTFDLAYSSYGSWTSDQCSRMLDALRRRLPNEQETKLEQEGLFESDPLFQPITERQLRQELIDAQTAYKQGDFVDALSFCDEMERHR